MTARRHHAWLAAGVPVLAGSGLLAAGLLLLPDRREVMHASRRAQPVAPSSPPMTLPIAAPPIATRPAALPPTPPSIAGMIATANATSLAATTARLIAAGQTVTTAQVAYDLVAAGRPAVALAYLEARPDGAAPATWALRIDLLRRNGRMSEAVTAVARARKGVAPADLIAAAYAIDRPDLIVAAAARGTIPPPDTALALDLARRADAAGRSDLIALLDRATRADWRGADPWLAIRIATRSRDTAAALRAADRLPPDQREAARETIVTATGDRDGLRRLLLARAAAPDAPLASIAEQLLAAGFRDDARAILRRAATGQAMTSQATQRLLYLMGPRPAAVDLDWLRQQATRGAPADQPAWLSVYAQRDRPAAALAVLSHHPLAARTDVMLTRLSLARAAGNEAAARDLASALLDGRDLTPAQLRTVAAAAPADAGGTIARRRIAAGVAEPRDAIDLAWAAWNAGDAAGTVKWLRNHLATAPDDPVALRLMADAQARIGGAAAARPWLEQALAQTSRGSRASAELLDRLGRRAEAIAVVEALRADAPQDAGLKALHARLLIAQGQPGRARTVLAQ
jgi:hypothetical protein